MTDDGTLKDLSCGNARQFTCRLSPINCPAGYVLGLHGDPKFACYKHEDTESDWASSQAVCEAAGAKLAVVADREELEYVAGLCGR